METLRLEFFHGGCCRCVVLCVRDVRYGGYWSSFACLWIRALSSLVSLNIAGRCALAAWRLLLVLACVDVMERLGGELSRSASTATIRWKLGLVSCPGDTEVRRNWIELSLNDDGSHPRPFESLASNLDIRAPCLVRCGRRDPRMIIDICICDAGSLSHCLGPCEMLAWPRCGRICNISRKVPQ